MSIRDVISDCLADGRLFHRLPPVPSDEYVRTMVLSADVNDVLLPDAWPENADGIRFGRLAADLDKFVQGQWISFGWHPYEKNKSAYMARTDDVRDGIIDVRSVDPRPSIRVFGGFAERDLFVALTWEWRGDLQGPGSKEWRYAIERCKGEWRKLLYPYTPIVGENVHDYISAKVFPV